MLKQNSTKKPKSQLDKATHTWLVKSYTHKLAHPNSEHLNSTKYCVEYLTRNSLRNDRLEAAATAYYYKNTIETKLQRIKRSPKLKKAHNQIPKAKH